MKVYKNAVVATRKDTTLPNLNPNITTGDLWIGQYATYNFKGLIPEVCIYDWGLSEEGIKAHFSGARVPKARQL